MGGKQGDPSHCRAKYKRHKKGATQRNEISSWQNKLMNLHQSTSNREGSLYKKMSEWNRRNRGPFEA